MEVHKGKWTPGLSSVELVKLVSANRRNLGPTITPEAEAVHQTNCLLTSHVCSVFILRQCRMISRGTQGTKSILQTSFALMVIFSK